MSKARTTSSIGNMKLSIDQKTGRPEDRGFGKAPVVATAEIPTLEAKGIVPLQETSDETNLDHEAVLLLAGDAPAAVPKQLGSRL